MQIRLITLILSLISALATGGLSNAEEVQSPKQVVERYWKLETNGERLTDQGWSKLESFRVHPSPPPRTRSIVVVSTEYSVWDPAITATKASVNVGLRTILGEIDDEMRFVRSRNVAAKEGRLFKLVLTSRHWKLDLNGRLTEFMGPPEWKIDEPSSKIWLNVETAIQYVTDIRNKSASPEIKRNAVQTLNQLGHFHEH